MGFARREFLDARSHKLAGCVEQLVAIALVGGLCVDANHRIGARGAHEHPGAVGEIEAQAVGMAHLDGRAPGDRLGVEPGQDGAQDRDLPRLEADVAADVAAASQALDAALEKLREAHAAHGDQLAHEQAAQEAVTLVEMARDDDAAVLLAADEDGLLA